VRLYQHAARNSESGRLLIQKLHELYDQIWAPLAVRIPGPAKRAILCPDGELNLLSFATLLSPDDKFLAESMELSYVSSGRDLLAVTQTNHNGQFHIWASPEFGEAEAGKASGKKNTLISGREGLRFDQLPGAAREARLVAEQARELGFAVPVLHLGTNATEAGLYELRSPTVLHLATHGFFLPEFSQTPKSEDEDAAGLLLNSRANPMFRSGLALSGAQRTIEHWAGGRRVDPENDGIVTVGEIATLDLRRTRLVVLSACDTGLGEVRIGEGVLGLRRGFIQAGAQNLLITLWPIDDVSAVDLMRDFYSELKTNEKPARALWRVQAAWFGKLRATAGLAHACRAAGPYILTFQGRPD